MLNKRVIMERKRKYLRENQTKLVAGTSNDYFEINPVNIVTLASE